MGRRQYLQRLALGRSAFEDLPEQVEDEAADNDGDTEQATVANDSNHYVQQYDRKGRPTNPATEAFNARLRHAQNSVLALVGVVERKESQDLAAQHALSAKRAHREHLLQQENDRGDEIETLANVAAFLLTWLPETLLRRLEVGLHDDMLFSVTVAGELTAVLGCGWRGLGGALWPGMGSMLSYRLAWYAIAGGVEEIVSWVQGRALASDMRRQTTRRVVVRLRDALRSRRASVADHLTERSCVPLRSSHYLYRPTATAPRTQGTDKATRIIVTIPFPNLTLRRQISQVPAHIVTHA